MTMMQQKGTTPQSDDRKRILDAVSSLINDILKDRSVHSEYIAGAMRVLEEVEHLCHERFDNLSELKTPS